MNDTDDSIIDPLNNVQIGALSNPPMRPVWIADSLFYRFNRSIKYDELGNMLILDETPTWNDIWIRLFNLLPYLCGYFLSILLNLLLLTLSLSKARKCDHRKVHCLLGNLAICNTLLSTGFLIYTFIIDVYYEVDSFNTLLNINFGSNKFKIWPIAKQIIHTELIDNMSLTQSIILMFISIDRYLSLFENYSPYVKHPIFIWIINILPYFLSIFVFDLHLMSIVVGINTSTVIRLAIFITTIPLSVVFSVCAVVRLIQKPKTFKRKKDDLSCAVTLLFILLIQLIEKFGLFMELLHNNFYFEITVGSRDGDLKLKIVMSYVYMITHYLFLSSPLYIPTLLLLFVGFYRSQIYNGLRRLWRCITCKPREHFDYNTETMKSIIEEQKRQRRMQRYAY